MFELMNFRSAIVMVSFNNGAVMYIRLQAYDQRSFATCAASDSTCAESVGPKADLKASSMASAAPTKDAR